MKKIYATLILGIILSGCEESGIYSDTAGESTINNSSSSTAPTSTFVVVDTGQQNCYDNTGAVIGCNSGNFSGQDASYSLNSPSYTDNGDGTVTDNNTGLMWTSTTINNVSFDAATTVANSAAIGNYDDWRVPTIKELYSLIDFSGVTGTSEADATPYIDTNLFDMTYASTGTRHIDAQYLSSTSYVGTTLGGDATFFGVNFADGRIKGYPKYDPATGAAKEWNLRLVRGTEGFNNTYVDNRDSTVTDQSTGLMWMQYDSGNYGGTAGTQGDGSLDWAEALSWCEGLSYAGYSDWRLPNAKELQSIIDYTRAPDITGSPAIDPLFFTTSILDPEGNPGQYPYFWSSTSHLDGLSPGDHAVYVAFGEAQGYMDLGNGSTLYDVHGAGAQRSDPKSGVSANYPDSVGPQGDIRYVYNYARCVR